MRSADHFDFAVTNFELVIRPASNKRVATFKVPSAARQPSCTVRPPALPLMTAPHAPAARSSLPSSPIATLQPTTSVRDALTRSYKSDPGGPELNYASPPPCHPCPRNSCRAQLARDRSLERWPQGGRGVHRSAASNCRAAEQAPESIRRNSVQPTACHGPASCAASGGACELISDMLYLHNPSSICMNTLARSRP